MNSNSLIEKITNKSARIGIIGMGYVGLPLAILAARKGYTVAGLLRTKEKAQQLSEGSTLVDTIDKRELVQVLKNKTFIPTVLDASQLQKLDVIIICVPTPIFHDKKPDLSSMKSVASAIKASSPIGKLIINESTVAPGTTATLFSFLGPKNSLACSPERVDPGNMEHVVSKIDKVVGGRDPQSLALAEKFYKNILEGNVIAVSSLEGAEMAKMLENTYRAVNIALINEIAMLCEKLGVDVLEVIRAASTKWSFQPHYPGIGVGGHCIPVDPYYIYQLARELKSPMTVVPAALSRNNDMPGEILKKLLKVYKVGMSVLIYGITYKKNVSDIRESPVLVLCDLLRKQKIRFTVVDPHLTKNQIESLGLDLGPRAYVDIFIIGADHDELGADLPTFVSDSTVVIDAKNALQKKVGSGVFGVGRKLS